MMGLAVGDALGAPLEGLSAPSRNITGMVGGGLHALPPGQYTDDTLQAAALARSLIACSGLDTEDILLRLIDGYRRHPGWYGPTSSAVFLKVMGEVPRHEHPAADRGIQGRTNGSLMRGLPLGVWYPPSAVRTPSMTCSMLTHSDPVAGECSAFVNLMISHLCRGGDREKAFREALASCEDTEMRAILGEYRSHPPEPSIDVVSTTHCAVRVFLESHGFRDALITAVNLGGDADTVGAVCGALAGAAWGLESIPLEWLLLLRDAPELFLLSADLAAAAIP